MLGFVVELLATAAFSATDTIVSRAHPQANGTGCNAHLMQCSGPELILARLVAKATPLTDLP